MRVLECELYGRTERGGKAELRALRLKRWNDSHSHTVSQPSSFRRDLMKRNVYDPHFRTAPSSVELVPDVQSFMRLLSVCMRVRGLCREGSECRETWQEARKDADEWQKCARCQAKSYEIWATATRNTFFFIEFFSCRRFFSSGFMLRHTTHILALRSVAFEKFCFHTTFLLFSAVGDAVLMLKWKLSPFRRWG